MTGLEQSRLLFAVQPPADPQLCADKEILVVHDDWGTGLMVIPLAQARYDVDYIQAMMLSRTVGEVRSHADAWAKVSEEWDARHEDEDADFPLAEQLSDDEPFDAVEWLGDESYYFALPYARLRTAETAPECIDPFLREDHAYGMDYEPAPWLSDDDLEEIEAALAANGYVVVSDDALGAGYMY